MDESKIINQIRKGDIEHYRLLLQRYQPGLVLHCFAMVHSYDIANDLAQEACIKAFFQLKNYNSTYRFSTWLYKIATNVSLDFLRKRKHVSLDDIPPVASSMPSPQEQVIKNDEAHQLHVAVGKLPLKYQTVISLYYWQERSYEEIATIINKPIGTVRTWLKRAKEKLKEELHG